MRTIPPEDCIIHLAKALGISENRLVNALFIELENEANEEVLDNLYWEFQEDNKTPDKFNL